MYVRNFALNMFKLKYKIPFSTFQVCLTYMYSKLFIPDSCKQFTYHIKKKPKTFKLTTLDEQLLA